MSKYEVGWKNKFTVRVSWIVVTQLASEESRFNGTAITLLSRTVGAKTEVTFLFPADEVSHLLLPRHYPQTGHSQNLLTDWREMTIA
jgi:hypothetical protein